MKKWKVWQISLFVFICVALNVAGRTCAEHFQLPLWLDSFGTSLGAWMLGPICGSIIGVTGNFIYGMANSISWIYGLVSIVIGVIVGLAARRGSLRTMFGAMSTGVLTALACVAVSVPLNVFWNGGSTGNIWGDGVTNFLLEQHYPWILSEIVGTFYLEFADKLVTLILLFAVITLAGLIRKKVGAAEPAGGMAHGGESGSGGAAGGAAMCFLLLAASLLVSSQQVSAYNAAAEAAETIAYSDYVQTVYSSSNGLPCGEANDIAETDDGILWIGTYAGLYRYNGSEFRWMDDYESVRNVNCLYVDTEGRLWIGTNDNGFSISIGEKIVNVVDQSKGLPSNSVRCITQSADGCYYIGTTGSMQIFTLSSGLKRVNTLAEVNYADNIAADDLGNVAAVTSNGRLFLMRGGQILSSLQLTGGEEIFDCVCFDEKGYLLAGSSTNHIYRYDISEGHFAELSVTTCTDLMGLNGLAPNERGEIFALADNGLGYLDARRVYHSINVNDFNNSIDNMQTDYQGNLWFTSSRLGLLRMSQSSFKDIYTTAGLESRVVNTVTKWQGNYYFGTDNGLDCVDLTCRMQVRSELTESLDGIRIRCMYTDSADHLWICTYGQGLIEVNPDGSTVVYNSENGSFGNRSRLVTELVDGTIVAAGDTGMCFIRDHDILQTIGYADGLINSMILTVTELGDGRILAGTDGDGIAVLENRQVTSMLTRDDGLSSEVILRTVKDPLSDGVYIVTSNGLCYMEDDGSIRPLNNFPYFNNYDVWVKDDNTLFVMGSSGIYVVSRSDLLADKEDMSYDLLDARKGLGSAVTANSWNYDDGDGDLFLSCDRGVFIADTNRYTSDGRSYRMSISAVSLDGAEHDVDKNGTIHVSRGTSRIELFPEIINYTIQDPYAGYYLEGFEEDWNILPQSSMGTIVYTNLPTGEYTFHLAVFDSNRDRILEERVYPLVKEQQIYDTHYFKIYMLVVAMLAVACFAWFIARTQVQRTINMQRRELEIAQQQVQMGNQTVIAIAKAVDAKDERTSQHSKRVSEYAVLIGREIGFSETECENLRKAARMHDIGKIGVPDSILNKPARLTDDEYTVMKSHTTRGGEILKDFTLLDHVVDGALYHHERYDGRGYPHGLKGEEIPLYGRIIGVADAFDAMTANRVYRKQMDFGYVLNEMKNGRGTQFDPQMVDILLRLIDEGKIDLKALYPELAEEEKQETRVDAKPDVKADTKADEKADLPEGKQAVPEKSGEVSS